MKNLLRNTLQSALLILTLFLSAGTHADTIFVGNDWGREIWMFDTAIGAESRAFFCNDIQGVNGMTFDREGNLFISDFGTRSIVKFTPDGKRTTFAQLDSSGGGLAFDARGNLFVPFQWGKKIEKISPDGKVQTLVTNKMNRPVVIAFDTQGNMFAADQHTGDIHRFGTDGSESTFARGLKGLLGIAFDRDGVLYAASSGDERTIFTFTPDGKRSVFADNIKANSIAFDSMGNLFVTTGEEGELIKYPVKSGKLSSQSELVDDNLGHDYFMAISPKNLPYAALRLPPGVSLAGSVHDADGNPIMNAIVFAGQDRYMNGAVRVKTDALGNFNLKRLPVGQNYLTISARGCTPDFRAVSLATNNEPLAVVLKPGYVIHGRVVNDAGQPLTNASVAYEGLANRNGMFTGRTIEWKTKTDANGEFIWDSAPAEPVHLNITKKGYMAAPWTTVQTTATNLTVFQLALPLTVKGSVADADTGAALASFKIIPGWPQGSAEQAWFEKQLAKNGTNGQYEVYFDRPIVSSETPMDFVFQISAPGYAPTQSRAIKPGEGVVVWDVKLKKTPAITGLVKTAEGEPAAGVKVYLASARDYLQLDGTSVNNQNREGENYETDAAGHFQLPAQAGGFNLVAASPLGFACVSGEEFTNRPTLTLQSWGRVEGTLLNHGRPYPGQEIFFFAGDRFQNRNVWSKDPVTVDVAGHFTITNVPPGTIRLNLKQPMTDTSWTYQELQTIEVKPGETNVVQLAMNGRAVIGHWKRAVDLTEDVNTDQASIFLRPEVASPPIPAGMTLPELIQKWFETWLKTAEGKKYGELQGKMCQLQIKSDGTLLGKAITPGKYNLTGNFWGNGGQLAELETRVVIVPELSTNEADTPFDLGEVIIKPVKHLNIGDTAPDFTVTTLAGQPLKLSDYHGKFVLLDFWATWCGPCVAETPHMKAAYDAYGTDSRFVMISLSLDQNTGLPKNFAQSHDLKWVQGYLGDWSKDTVTKDYCVRGIPSIFLIGPDGKIIAQNLRGEAIKSTVGTALGK